MADAGLSSDLGGRLFATVGPFKIVAHLPREADTRAPLPTLKQVADERESK
mgnify:CR=1 FL=1